MDNSVKMQTYIFLTTIYGGLIVGIIYDFYRSFRYFFKPTKLVTLIQDLVFWIIVSFIAFFILIKSNWGELRGYVFLGFFLGALLYFKVLSKFIYSFFINLFKIVIIIFREVFYIISLPFRFIIKVILLPMKKVKKINKFSLIMTRNIKKYKKIISKKK